MISFIHVVTFPLWHNQNQLALEVLEAFLPPPPITLAGRVLKEAISSPIAILGFHINYFTLIQTNKVTLFANHLPLWEWIKTDFIWHYQSLPCNSHHEESLSVRWLWLVLPDSEWSARLRSLPLDERNKVEWFLCPPHHWNPDPLLRFICT